ncbi:hypothetical protein FCR2A7T_04640 [Flavobacterium cauense R2A-7]|nr:hypothetical protein FCR2A7T_04640 [Flavobacterium cauense R2A-7]
MFISELFIADFRFQSGNEIRKKTVLFFLYRTLIFFLELFIKTACGINEKQM